MAKIGLDIGHGRNTFPPSKGVYKNGKAYHEHDANSRVAAELAKLLKAAGHTIVMAQKAGHNDVPLTKRTSIYFAENVDLIVSCHANAGVASASGYASFYWYNDSKAKKLSDLYEEEIQAQGFKLWGGSRPSMPGNVWNNFHMCREPAKRGVPSILLENGFMTNAHDFEWIFGSKKHEYAKRCATAAFNAIQRYLGKSTTKPKVDDSTKSNTARYRVRKSANDSSSQIGAFYYLDGAKEMADENKGKGYKVYEIATGKLVYDPNKKSSGSPNTGSSNNIKVGSKVVLSKNATKYATGQTIPSYVKGKTYTIQQIKSDRVLLKEIYSWVYKKDVGLGSSSSSSSGSGSSSGSTAKKPSTGGSVKVGSKVVLSKNATKYATGETIPAHIKGKTYTIMQMKSDRVLLKEIYSWVYKKDVGLSSGSGSSSTPKTTSFKVGAKVKLKNTASKYATGQTIPSYVKGKTYTIQQVKSDRVLLKEIYSWVYKKDVQ